MAHACVTHSTSGASKIDLTKSVDSHMDIIRAFHSSFSVCICRLCQIHEKIKRWRTVFFCVDLLLMQPVWPRPLLQILIYWSCFMYCMYVMYFSKVQMTKKKLSSGPPPGSLQGTKPKTHKCHISFLVLLKSQRPQLTVKGQGWSVESKGWHLNCADRSAISQSK